MLSVLNFVLFIIVFMVFAAMSNYVISQQQKKDSFHSNILSVVIGVVPIFIFPFVLTGYLDIQSLLIFSILSVIGLMIGRSAQWFLGLGRYPTEANIRLASAEIFVRSPLPATIFMMFSMAILLVYIIIIGYIHFSYSGQQKNIYILQTTILCFSITGFLFALQTIFKLLSSEHIDEDLRTILFIRQTTTLLPTIALLSIGLSAFNITTNYGIFVANYNVPTLPLIIAMAIFLFFVILPYFLGVQKANYFRNEMQKRKILTLRNYRKNLIDSSNKNNYLDAIERFQNYIKQEIKKVLDSNDIIKKLIQGDEYKPELNVLVQNIDYDVLKKHDERIKYLKFLIAFRDLVDTSAHQIRQSTSDTEASNKANVFVNRADIMLDEVNDDTAVKATRPLVFTFISSVAFTVLGIALSTLGKTMWDRFVQIQVS